MVAAAFLKASLPADALSHARGGLLELAIVALISIPSYVCAPSATPLFAVLIAKGLSPGAALVGLLLGPATNIATLALLRRWYGGRGVLLVIAAVVAPMDAFSMLFQWVALCLLYQLGIWLCLWSPQREESDFDGSDSEELVEV